MMYLQKLVNSRAWYQLVPDLDHDVLIEGYSFWDEQLGSIDLIRKHFDLDDYATAAITQDRKTAFAYLPTKRKITINMNKISGTHANCWWFNPSNGSAVKIGSYPTTGDRQFEPPGKR